MTTRRLAFVALAVSLLVGAVPGRAAQLDVDDDRAENPAAPWTTISDAVAAALRGDTIRVYPGTYNEQVVVTQDVNVIAVPWGGEPVIVQPLSLTETRQSLIKYFVPITAGILVDGARATLDGIQLDMSMSGVAACSPVLTGVYMRNSSGNVRRMTISGTRVVADSTCESGVGLYVESGKDEEFFGEPVLGSARVHVFDNLFVDYQKAGLAANGRFTGVSGRNQTAMGSGPSAGAVQYGLQVGGAAKARIRNVVARDHASTISAKTAAGMLVHRASRVRLGQPSFLDSQTGLFVVGGGTASFSGGFENMSDDGIVFLGDVNLSMNSNIHQMGNTGVFINGFRNAVRGGFISDIVVGVWIYRGLLNRFSGIRFQDVPIEKQGVYGGERDLTEAHVDPFLTCRTGADCDDANACTYDLCDPDRALCYYVTVQCEDFNVCTDDSCDPSLGCQNIANVAACDDQTVCTTADLCAAGVCAGTAIVCDDANECTTDSCDAVLGCQAAPVADGTACGVAMTCTAGVCS